MKTPEELLEEGIITIPLGALLEYWDPILDNVWGCGPITEDEVRNYTGPVRSSSAEYISPDFSDKEFNVGRIAYLLEHGWDAADVDLHPVTVDVGMSGYTSDELVVDGNHRVAAAKFRGDETITVSIIGDIDKAIAVFQDGMYIDDY